MKPFLLITSLFVYTLQNAQMPPGESLLELWKQKKAQRKKNNQREPKQTPPLTLEQIENEQKRLRSIFFTYKCTIQSTLPVIIKREALENAEKVIQDLQELKEKKRHLKAKNRLEKKKKDRK